MQRIKQSDHAILQFENLRLLLKKEPGTEEKRNMVDRKESIVKDEIARTELSLSAAARATLV